MKGEIRLAHMVSSALIKWLSQHKTSAPWPGYIRISPSINYNKNLNSKRLEGYSQSCIFVDQGGKECRKVTNVDDRTCIHWNSFSKYVLTWMSRNNGSTSSRHKKNRSSARHSSPFNSMSVPVLQNGPSHHKEYKTSEVVSRPYLKDFKSKKGIYIE